MKDMRLINNEQRDFLTCHYAFGKFGIRIAGWVRWHSAVASSDRLPEAAAPIIYTMFAVE